jgi:hypothetical protein
MDDARGVQLPARAARLMDASAFDALFDTFTHSTFRLEALQAYAVSAEDARLRAFRDGTARPERSVRTDPWLRRIAVSTAGGKSWSRVHLVRHPLSEYLHYELVSYVESQAVGEQIGIVDLAAHPLLTGPDFWLFDWDTAHAQAVVMHYSPDGRVQEREYVTDPIRLARMNQIRIAAQDSAIPLNSYLAVARSA